MLSVAIQQSSQTNQPLWWKEGKIFKVLFTITPTNVNSPGNANPYVAGGDTLDLTQLFGLLAGAPGGTIPTFENVAKVDIHSFRPKGNADSSKLYEYSYAPNTSLANGTMQVYQVSGGGAPLAELGAGNYPANLLDDVIQAEAYFIMP